VQSENKTVYSNYTDKGHLKTAKING